MTPSDPNTFDDPQLKAALRRAWGDEVAPASLRAKVLAMGIGAASAPAADITPAPAAPGRNWFRTVLDRSDDGGAARARVGRAGPSGFGREGPGRCPRPLPQGRDA